MADVATLISNLELLEAGQPIPGDERPVPIFGTVGNIRATDAGARCGALASMHIGSRAIPSRLACELVDNLPTVLAALRYWHERHSNGC
ncbi:hypothetical protein J2Y54_000534 [Sphingomonas sp. BE123]|uniref:hypothetical protein n=1 Tax=Sphingomonas sp. BE123 TaxID=2817842 RepID=UPI002864645A|nr:hypothetical protein [Sphingomonas sp. BE123]MDR6851041.1 hypothetical protein [Sphingomonas sp. BE123]